MQYRKYGKTNEEVSILGFGCMRLPLMDNDQGKIDENQAIEMVRYAIDQGVNYIDTAYPYHNGQSEPFVAKALKEGYREKVKIATKLPSWLIESRQDMDKYLNEQLERLETEVIDFYLVHALNKRFWSQLKKHGLFDFLKAAQADGRVKHVGFSFHDDLDTFKEIVEAYDWEFCQIQYNYLDENYQAGKEGLEFARDRGLGIAIMEPLRGGRLAGEMPEDIKDLWSASHIDRSPAQWALKWLWNHPEVDVVLSGMSLLEHVEDNVKTANDAKAHGFSQKEVDLMAATQKVFNDRLKVNCTACKYCMPCPVGVDIPASLNFYNEAYLFDDMEASKKMYGRFVKEENKASNCIACGKCESACPQNIAIIKALKDITEIF